VASKDKRVVNRKKKEKKPYVLAPRRRTPCPILSEDNSDCKGEKKEGCGERGIDGKKTGKTKVCARRSERLS
jgi:hypothetical protein